MLLYASSFLVLQENFKMPWNRLKDSAALWNPDKKLLFICGMREEGVSCKRLWGVGNGCLPPEWLEWFLLFQYYAEWKKMLVKYVQEIMMMPRAYAFGWIFHNNSRWYSNLCWNEPGQMIAIPIFAYQRGWSIERMYYMLIDAGCCPCQGGWAGIGAGCVRLAWIWSSRHSNKGQAFFLMMEQRMLVYSIT